MQCGRAGTVSVGGQRSRTLEEAAVEAGVENQVEEYYYNHLPEELHEAYREIYVHLMKNEDSGSFLSEIDVDNFWKAYYAGARGSSGDILDRDECTDRGIRDWQDGRFLHL